VAKPGHPLLREVNTRFDVPHSRHNDISRKQLKDAGLTVLIDSVEGGVHMAVSPDQFRLIYFQGHPEYDSNSLLKEFKRELCRYLDGETNTVPPFPEHYFSNGATAVATRMVDRFVSAKAEGLRSTDMDTRSFEAEFEARIDNTWGDSAKAVINNWLGLVYKVTNLDRTRQFMAQVDPDDPLNLNMTGASAGQNPSSRK
jgi:homoserine O-succinyltransferase